MTEKDAVDLTTVTKHAGAWASDYARLMGRGDPVALGLQEKIEAALRAIDVSIDLSPAEQQAILRTYTGA